MNYSFTFDILFFDVLTPTYLKDDDLSDPDVLLFVVGQEEEVSPVEGGLHRPAEDDDDRRLRSRHHHQTLPDHQGRRDDHAKTQALS